MLIRGGTRTVFGTASKGPKVFVFDFLLGTELFVTNSLGKEEGRKVSEIRCGCELVVAVVWVLVEQEQEQWGGK